MFLSIEQVKIFRTWAVRICVAAACVMSLSLTTAAQTATTGIVRGTVQDPDTAIIPGATVTLLPVSGAPIPVTSGSDGTYRLVAPAGTYTMTVSMPGFATLNKTGVRVIAGQTVTVDAKLIVGEQTQIVNVTSDIATVGVDADSNASSTIIKGKDLDALSDDPDELQSELSALAGPAAGPNGGQIYVDGFTGGQLPPKSSIREIRINQNPFSAEYDRLGYGRIEVFTKPGTDKLHGSISTQGNTGGLNTSNPFLGSANNQPGYYTFFLMGNVTGPITKNSSFSVGGNRRSINNNAIIDPTAFFASSATSTTLCNPGDLTCGSFPFPVSARAILQPQVRSEISPRLDFALGSKNVLTVRYQYEGGSNTNGGIGTNTLPTAAYNSDNSENTLQISDTQTVSSKIVNETRFEYQRGVSNQTAISTAPTLSVQGFFTGGGSSGQKFSSVSSHIELQNYTSIALEKHFLRFGGRLRSTGEDLTSTSGSNGSFTYSYLLDPCTDPSVTNKPAGCSTAANVVPCDPRNLTANNGNYFASYQCGYPSQFRQTKINAPTVHDRTTDVGLYAEDDWKLKPNLTFSYGIRYETQSRIHSNRDFAPRLSVAYGVPRGNGKPPITVLRGGFGVFYDRFALGDLLTLQQFSPASPAQTQTTVLNPGINCGPVTFNCGTGTAGKGTVYTPAANLRSSYTMQGAAGVDQQIGRLGTISVNYLLSRGNHEFLTRLTQTAGAYNYEFDSGGVFNQQQIFVNANIRTKKVTMFGFYALGFANSNTSGSGFIPTSNNPRVDYGRAAFNTRSFAVMGASYTAPFKISASPFLIARSGSPYNITTGTDVNNDSVFNDRPAFASGSSANCTNASTFTTPAAGSSYSEIPINYCTGPANFSFNLRLGRSFGFGPKLDGPVAANGGRNGGGGGGGRGPGGGGGRGGGMMPGMAGGGGPMGGGGASTGRRFNLNLGAQAQNLFNVVPYSAPVGTLSNPRFGTFTSIQGRPFSSGTAVRSITLQATLNF